MVLVDTSVLIDYFRNIENSKSLLFDNIIQREIPFGISCFTYQELLQGARDINEFDELKLYLSYQTIYSFPQDLYFYENCAKTFFDLRRAGKTVRSSIDMLIAQTAVKFDLFLLHNDKDFDVIAEIVKNLKILGKIDDLY
jgi:predicted nucleic acid-binding protein